MLVSPAIDTRLSDLIPESLELIFKTAFSSPANATLSDALMPSALDSISKPPPFITMLPYASIALRLDFRLNLPPLISIVPFTFVSLSTSKSPALIADLDASILKSPELIVRPPTAPSILYYVLALGIRSILNLILHLFLEIGRAHV